MGNTKSEQRDPSGERLSLAGIVPRWLLVGQVALVSGFGMVIMGVVGLTHYANPPRNPFAAYADIFPGEANITLAAHGFECRGERYNYAQHISESFCYLVLKSGAFSHIEVTYSNGLIRTLHFAIRDEILGLGDLVTLLDATQLSPKLPFTFHWRGGVGFAGISRLHNPHFFTGRHVREMTLTDGSLPAIEP